MKICGFEKSMAFFNFIPVVLMIIGGARGFTVIRSSNGYRDPDRFSNPYCRPFDCRNIYRGTAGCSTRDCCYCQCNHSKPNYVIYSRRCVPNDEVDEDCELFVPPVDAPLFVADMTKPGKIPFRGDVCPYTLRVQSWSYRLTDFHWKTGSPNNFRTEPALEDPYSWSLLWDRGLDAKYSGLILRFHFTCRGGGKGCLLIKVKGNYTFPDSGLPHPLPPLRPTDVAVDVTGGKANPTLDGGISSGTNGGEKNTAQTPAQMKRELEEKKTGIVVAGVTVSLAAGIVLVFATLLLRMKKQESAKMPSQRRPHNPNAAYEEPVDSNAHKDHAAAGTVNFHNAFYTSDCVLSISEPSTETEMTRPMGPLPPLPTEEEEGIYEEPVIKRNVNYQGLAAKENQQTAEPDDDAVSSVEQTRPPVYNVLERSVENDGEDDDDDDDDDYDDNVAECRKPDDDAVSSAVEQKRPPVYNVPVERSVDEDDDDDDDDDYDDNVAEFRRTTTV